MGLSFEVLIVPAEDLPGIWVALCPQLGVCTQGTSVPNAVEMAHEAIEMSIEDDLAEGRDPLDRERHDQWWDEIRRELEGARGGQNPDRVVERVTVEWGGA